jgi:alpha-L-fucosidase
MKGEKNMQYFHWIVKKIFLLIIFFSITFYTSSAQTFGGGEANPKLLTNKESLKKWQDMRFGMFIHWGPVTLRGTEIGWSRGPQVAIEEYDNLYKEFNLMPGHGSVLLKQQV